MMLEDVVRERLGKAVRILPVDVKAVLAEAARDENDPLGSKVLERILQNIDIAEKSALPLCQDCGMFTVIISVGRDSNADICSIVRAIEKGCREAAEEYFYRKSIVDDPVYDRINTRNNMPPSISIAMADGSDVEIGIILKGFGSENCSSVRMLRPTGGEDAVVDAVIDIMKKAGGKPCPPVFLGVGIGGTMENAALLSKKALLRDAGVRHSDPRYGALEKRLMKEVNALGIGPGGLGGSNTCLNVACEYMSTHIAGLPVAVSVNCWADRKVLITLKGGSCEEIS